MTHADPLLDADIKRHQRFLEALARQLGGGEDAVQDTWLRVLEHGRTEGRGWLASVLRSQTIDRHRAQARRRRRELKAARSEATQDSLQPLLDAEALEGLQAGLEKLPRKERRILELRYLEQVPPREIARQRSVPVEQIYRELERGRNRLREDLGEESRFGAAGLLTAAALSWKALAVVPVIVLMGVAWRVSGGPPQGTADMPTPVLIDEELAVSETVMLTKEVAAVQREVGREPIANGVASRKKGQAALPSANLDLTVHVGSETDAGGIHAHFVPQSNTGAHAPDEIDIELPRSGQVTVKLAAGCAYVLTLRSPLDKGLEPVVERRLSALEANQVKAWTIDIPEAGLRTFAARVIKKEGRSPIAAAQIVAVDDGRLLATSDATGAFQFDIPREGIGVMRLLADGFGPALVETENEGRPEQAEFVIDLERAAGLIVRGWEHLGSDPGSEGSRGGDIEAMVLCHPDELAHPEGSRLQVERYRCAPEREGSDLIFTGLPPDVPLSLEFRQGDELLHRNIEPLVLAAGERRVLELRHDAQRYLVGRLQQASGAGLAGREVWLLHASADAVDPWRLLKSKDDPLRRVRTGAQGNFEFRDVPEGRWWLGPAPGQDDLAPYARLHIQDSALETRVDLEATPIYLVHGRVQVPDGRSGDLRVWAGRSDVDGSIQASATDEHFEIGPLLPGRWRLNATLDFFERSRTIYVEVPSAPNAEVELIFDDTFTIAGRIIDGETDVPEQAHVSLVSNGSSSMTTGPDGSFRFPGRRPRTYTLCAQTPDGRVGFLPGIELRARSLEDLTLAVFPAARLQLSVQGEGPSPRCRILAGGDLYQDFTLDRGVTTLQAVPATSIQVIVYSHNNGDQVVHSKRSLVAAPGSTEPMEFVID